jgi:hypothetical protein
MLRNRMIWAASMVAFALGAWPAFAQTTQAPAPSQPAKSAPQRPKKVWTNENLDELTSTGGVTTATATLPSEGGTPAALQAPGTTPGQQKELTPDKDPKVYRAKLESLRKQLADTEAKIKDIQDALNNPIEGTNKINPRQPAPNLPPQDQPPGYDKRRPDNAIYGNQIVRPQDQLEVYEKKRQELQQQIDDLEAQARQNGINPGDIR